ncbi:MAG: amidohydrolase family protein [Phycisphaerales bacterium]|nr:amidohydrolase family protein [Phycisphaerales bacterium]
MRRLLDSHVHVWDLDRLNLPWLGSVPRLDRSYLTEDYLAALPEIESIQAVYLEVDAASGDEERELELVDELLRDEDGPFMSAVVRGDPAAPDLAEWIARTSSVRGVSGFRTVLHTPDQPRGICLLPTFIEGVRSMGEAGMHFELCMREVELADAAELARAAPGTRLVLDHFGNASPGGESHLHWRDDISRIAEQENVFCKVSGFFQNAHPDWSVAEVSALIDHVRNCFGVERLMFGGNWPVCTLVGSLRLWIEVVDEVTRHWSDRDRDALFHENADAFYGSRSGAG